MNNAKLSKCSWLQERRGCNEYLLPTVPLTMKVRFVSAFNLSLPQCVFYCNFGTLWTMLEEAKLKLRKSGALALVSIQFTQL